MASEMTLKFSAAVHVMGVVIWIGGVAFVTIILLPMIHAMTDPMEKALLFQRVEHRFSRIVKPTIILVGITGLYNLYEKGLYAVMPTLRGFWLDLMVGVFVFYALLIFGLEKALFRRIFKDIKQLNADQIFFRMSIFHWVVLALSLAAVGAGVIGTY